MKRTTALLILCLFFVMVTNDLSADFGNMYPYAFKDRFPPGSQKLGYSEGDVLQLGCFIGPVSSPIKEVTIKNLDSGLVLTAIPWDEWVGRSKLYRVHPNPPFNPDKHMGIWEIMAKNEKGIQATAKTHKLDINEKMPYLKGLKASGNPLAPKITWTAPNEKDLPKGIYAKYRVRLLKDVNNHFYKSHQFFYTTFQIPEGQIKPDDLSEIFVRVECYGYDKNDKEHTLPLELSSQNFMPLEKALGKQ